MERVEMNETGVSSASGRQARPIVRALRVGLLWIAAVLQAGCAAMAPSGGESPAWAQDAVPRALAPDLLVLDRADLALGSTVQFMRIPTPTEMRDLLVFPALVHVVLVLPEWPRGYADVQVLNLVPEGPDVIVVLPGYPPSQIASDAWNQISSAIRIVLLVDGPPPSYAVIDDLNNMRRLERVIAEMDEPRRAGFERLQRPLSFRKVME